MDGFGGHDAACGREATRREPAAERPVRGAQPGPLRPGDGPDRPHGDMLLHAPGDRRRGRRPPPEGTGR